MKGKRRTFAEIRAIARDERDIEIAAFLEEFAGHVRAKRADDCAGPTATALEGLAGSLRAGLVDEGMPG